MKNKATLREACDFFCRYHCLWIAGAFALGIIVHEEKFLNRYAAVAGFVIAVMCWGIFWKKNTMFFLFMGIIFLFLGMLHCEAVCFLKNNHIYKVFLQDRQKAVSIIGQVVGDVTADVNKRPYVTFYLDVIEIFYSDDFSCLVNGRILVRSFVQADVQSGDRLKVTGKMHLPYDFKMGGSGSYKAYLKQNGVYLILTIGKTGSIEKIKQLRSLGIIVRGRERIKGILNRFLPEFESGILRAVLIGDRTGISHETRQLFIATGTAHVLAISGLHMGIIMGIFFVCVGMVPTGFRLKYFFVAVLMVIYMPLAGWRPSVIRSGVMAGIFLLALWSERRFCSLNVLGLAAFVILIVRPLDLYSVGFQLSFSAALALIIFSDCFYGLFYKKGLLAMGEKITQSFSVSLAAWLGVAGLVLYHFGTLTPVGILANLCVVSLMTVAIILGLLLVCFGFLKWSLCSKIIAADIQILINVLMRVASGLSRIPFGHVENIFISRQACLLYYIFFLLVAAAVSWRKARKPSHMRGLS